MTAMQGTGFACLLMKEACHNSKSILQNAKLILSDHNYFDFKGIFIF